MEDVLCEMRAGDPEHLALSQLGSLAAVLKAKSRSKGKGKQRDTEERVEAALSLESTRWLASKLYDGLTSPTQAISLKSKDVIQLFAAQQRSGPGGSTILSDNLVAKATTGRAFMKYDLTVLDLMVPGSNSELWPADLLERIFEEVCAQDNRALGGRVLGLLLNDAEYISRQKLAGRAVGEDWGHDKAIAAVLLDQVERKVNDPNIQIALSRFLYPRLFELQPHLPSSLLQTLTSLSTSAASSSTRHATCSDLHMWIRVAAEGCGQSLISPLELDGDLMRKAMHHAVDDVRLAAWLALTTNHTPAKRVEEEVMAMVKEWMTSNLGVYSADFRTVFVPSFRKIIAKLVATASSAQKQVNKPPKTVKPEDGPAAQAYINTIIFFIDDTLAHVASAIEFPLSTNYPRLLTALDLLLAVTRETAQEGVPEKGRVGWPEVFARETVDSLFACLGSNYSDVRARAEEVLSLLPPGQLSEDARHQLFLSALSRLDGHRNTDAEMGALTIQVLSGTQPSRYLETLFSRLRDAIQEGERTSVKALRDRPVHGTFLAIARIIPAVTRGPHAALDQVGDYLKEALDLIERAWKLCRQIMSSEGSDSADHEIARVYELLEVEGDEGEYSSEDTVHHNLLSNCWRAVKEASGLLVTIFSQTASPNAPAELRMDDAQVRRAGDIYLDWLYHVRHRGTFTALTPDFERFVNVVGDLRPEGMSAPTLADQWLTNQIHTIKEGATSTTRRSAAIPFCVLALVQNAPLRMRSAHKRLVALIQDDGSRSSTKVHALHALRVSMLDTRQAKVLPDLAESTILAALSCWQNPEWSVRNAALLLFAHLVTRLMGKGINKPGSRVDKKVPIGEWRARYPSLLPVFADILTESSTGNIGLDSSPFLILLVLRHLEAGSTFQDEMHRRVRATAAIYLGSPEIKVRQAAADAVAAITPVEIWNEGDAIQVVASSNSNTKHGWALCMEAVLRQSVSASTRATLRRSLDSLGSASNLSPANAAAIQSTTLFASNGGPAPAIETLEQVLNPATSIDTRIETLHHLADNQGLSGSGSEYAKLARMYNIARHVPLKEAILPVLALVTPAFGKEDEAGVSSVIQDIAAALDEEQSADSRFAACKALRNLTNRLLSDPSPHSLDALLLIRTALQDDDIDIRRLAAEGIIPHFQHKLGEEVVSPLCRDAAEEVWRRFMQKEFGGQESWAEALKKELLDERETAALVSTLIDPASDLFVTEPANLFREPLSEYIKTHQAYSQLPHPLQAFTTEQRRTLGAIISRTEDGLRTWRQKQGLQEGEKPNPIVAGREEYLILQKRLIILKSL